MPTFLKPFISSSFWFRDVPDLTSTLGRAWLIGSAALVLAALACRIFSRRAGDRHAAKALRAAWRALSTMGILAFVLASLSYENAGILGSRVMYALWFVGALGWALWIAYGTFKLSPLLRQAERAKREKEKYLP